MSVTYDERGWARMCPQNVPGRLFSIVIAPRVRSVRNEGGISEKTGSKFIHSILALGADRTAEHSEDQHRLSEVKFYDPETVLNERTMLCRVVLVFLSVLLFPNQ